MIKWDSLRKRLQIRCETRARCEREIADFIAANKALLKKRMDACDLWKHRNYHEAKPPPPPLHPLVEKLTYVRKTKPQRGDFVTLDDKRHGKITYVQYSEGEIVCVSVFFNDGESKDFDSWSYDYSALHGRTHWFI